ncbi:hypothetical protein JTB14_025153 [Gonioctena quinquepunctata]|nr:hypothetical protein JTB14_025153 [Gonioctena quinquepunctata]
MGRYWSTNPNFADDGIEGPIDHLSERILRSAALVDLDRKQNEVSNLTTVKIIDSKNRDGLNQEELQPENSHDETRKRKKKLNETIHIFLARNENNNEFVFPHLDTPFGSLKELSRRGYGGTETLRENEIERNRNLSEKKRGESVEFSNGGLTATKWNDNAVMTVLSNCYEEVLMKNAEKKK